MQVTRFCLQLTWLVAVYSCCIFCFNSFYSFRDNHRSIYIPIYSISIGLEIFCLLTSHWMLALQYFQSSQTLPSFINDADQVTRMLGQRKSYKCAKQIGVAVAAGEGLLTAASNWLLGLNHAKWNWFFTWNFMLLGVIAILQTLLLQFSVSKMWASLAKSPGLQRNDRIMWVH